MKSAKSISYIAVMTALLLAAQFVLSGVAGVEVVTLLLAAFSAAFGVLSGVAVAVAFSLLRCFIYGFFPQVIVLYLIYYPLLALLFAFLGKRRAHLFVCIICAILSTAYFTALDGAINALFFSYNLNQLIAYLTTSLPVMGVQLVSVTVSFLLLYLPLTRVLERVKRM